MNNKVKIFMGVPSTGNIADTQTYALRAIQAKYQDHVELVYPDLCSNRIFHDAARNGIVEEFLQSDCDILWFLDSDVTPPIHILDLVVVYGNKWKVAGAPYPIFMAQSGTENRQVVFTVYKGIKGKGIAPADIPMSGIDEVDGLATGCLFIRREVLENLEKPYFQFKFDEESRSPVEGEDIGFCLRMAKLGIKFFVDYSMVCRHHKKLDLLELNNYAIEFAQKSIDRYDAEIRKNLEPAMRRLAMLEEERSKRVKTDNVDPSLLKTKSGLVIPKSLVGV